MEDSKFNRETEALHLFHRTAEVENDLQTIKSNHLFTASPALSEKVSSTKLCARIIDLLSCQNQDADWVSQRNLSSGTGNTVCTKLGKQ